MPKHQKPTVQTVKKQLKKIRDLSVELAEAEYELGLLGLVGIDRISNKKASTKKKASKKKASKKRASTKPLSLRDQKIVRLLLDQPELTQKEIASRFGIHQAQVSQIKKKAGIPMLSRSEVAEKMRKASKPKVKVSSKKPTKKTTRKTSGKKVFLSDTVFKEVKNALTNGGQVDAGFIESKHGKSARALVSPVSRFLLTQGAIKIEKNGRVKVLVRRNKKKLQSASLKKFKAWRKA